MTQMMLFPGDASTQRTPASGLPRTENVGGNRNEVAGHRGDIAVDRRLHASADATEGPAKRMGDLARLVILRYEIAAKRREQMQRRREQTAAVVAR